MNSQVSPVPKKKPRKPTARGRKTMAIQFCDMPGLFDFTDNGKTQLYNEHNESSAQTNIFQDQTEHTRRKVLPKMNKKLLQDKTNKDRDTGYGKRKLKTTQFQKEHPIICSSDSDPDFRTEKPKKGRKKANQHQKQALNDSDTDEDFKRKRRTTGKRKTKKVVPKLNYLPDYSGAVANEKDNKNLRIYKKGSVVPELLPDYSEFDKYDLNVVDDIDEPLNRGEPLKFLHQYGRAVPNSKSDTSSPESVQSNMSAKTKEVFRNVKQLIASSSESAVAEDIDIVEQISIERYNELAQRKQVTADYDKVDSSKEMFSVVEPSAMSSISHISTMEPSLSIPTRLQPQRTNLRPKKVVIPGLRNTSQISQQSHKPELSGSVVDTGLQGVASNKAVSSSFTVPKISLQSSDSGLLKKNTPLKLPPKPQFTSTPAMFNEVSRQSHGQHDVDISSIRGSGGTSTAQADISLSHHSKATPFNARHISQHNGLRERMLDSNRSSLVREIALRNRSSQVTNVGRGEQNVIASISAQQSKAQSRDSEYVTFESDCLELEAAIEPDRTRQQSRRQTRNFQFTKLKANVKGICSSSQRMSNITMRRGGRRKVPWKITVESDVRLTNRHTQEKLTFVSSSDDSDWEEAKRANTGVNDPSRENTRGEVSSRKSPTTLSLSHVTPVTDTQKMSITGRNVLHSISRIKNATVPADNKSFEYALTPQRNRRTGKVVTHQSKVFNYCNQNAPVKFTDVIDKNMFNTCEKIGEGTYGEVYRIIKNSQSVAVKIIPIEGDTLFNDEPQQKFKDILPEVVISSELSNLAKAVDSDGSVRLNMTENFVKLHDIHVIQDAYPSKLLQCWDTFANVHSSENDRPDGFPADQLFVAFLFSDAGIDLAHSKLHGVAQAWSIMRQLVFSLMVAEFELEFEHRDLHWGNVLIRPTDLAHLHFTIGGKRYRVESHGIHVSIIDFSNSRLSKDGITVYVELGQDEALFQGKGDYQFDIYRLMRKENNDKWDVFHSRSNVLWLDYIADKLCTEVKYSVKKDRQFRTDMNAFRRACFHLSKRYQGVIDIFTDSPELGKDLQS